MFTCPVCGYPELQYPPADYHICASCGTEFGVDDFDFSHEELRCRWRESGMPWFSRVVAQPPGWDPIAQLASLSPVRMNRSADPGSAMYVTAGSASVVRRAD